MWAGGARGFKERVRGARRSCDVELEHGLSGGEIVCEGWKGLQFS